MELRQLKYFLKVAERLNFSEAAADLYLTQSSLSQQVKLLEDELGAQLLSRNSHEVVLTEIGERFVPLAQKTLNDAEVCVESVKEYNNLMTGTLTIGVTYTFSPFITETLFAFMKAYPGVRLTITYNTMEELIKLLQHRKMDFVLAFRPNKPIRNIDSHALFGTRLSAVMRENHPLANRKSISLRELSEYDFALPARGVQARETLEKILSTTDCDINVRIEHNDIKVLVELLRRTNFVSTVALTAVHGEKGIVTMPLEETGCDMEGCVHTLKDSYVKASTREFCRMLGQSDAIREYSSLTNLI